MTVSERMELAERFEKELRIDILPFWIKHGADPECGGMLTGLGRAGEIIETDKSVWFQGRTAWVMSKAYEEYGDCRYLEVAESCVRFLDAYCFDKDGRMFFRVDRTGHPLIKRRYIFSEAFALIGYAAYGKVSKTVEYIRRAEELLERILFWSDTPGILKPKWNPSTRRMEGLAFSMIMIATLQELRSASPDKSEQWNSLIDKYIQYIQSRFMNYEVQALLEVTGSTGPLLDHFEGRVLNPGHSLEAAWFILREGAFRGNARYITLGRTILDWMWNWGWDQEFGGIYYYRDARELPSSEYWHDMKFWWPQCEAILANLQAWQVTGEGQYAEKAKLVTAWTNRYLRDYEFGEWFGYLHRDGSVSSTLKGNMFKGPFHIPRMMLFAAKLLRTGSLDSTPPVASPAG